MKCPICGSYSIDILKSKIEDSKTHEIEKQILKCNECETVFRETIKHEKPVDFRIIISELDNSYKDFIKIYPEDTLSVGDTLIVNNKNVKITSLENKQGGRVNKSIASNLVTIWASSLEIPVRVGVSIDFHGITKYYKVDINKDLKFQIGDILKIEDNYFRIAYIKTIERKLKKGFAFASVIKRIYGKPLDSKAPYQLDLTDYITKSSE
jgi:uncharacterized Zn finger protein